MMKQAMCYRGKTISITHDGHTGRIAIDEHEFSVKKIRFEHRLWACDRLYVMWPTLEQLARDLVDNLYVMTAKWDAQSAPVAAAKRSQPPSGGDEDSTGAERVSPA